VKLWHTSGNRNQNIGVFERKVGTPVRLIVKTKQIRHAGKLADCQLQAPRSVPAHTKPTHWTL